ncbi:MAG: AI-2E family transporter [Anaerolineaceae bacterium]|nr:AI-2E family transporter [Anaerolineaceae bacterium]
MPNSPEWSSRTKRLMFVIVLVAVSVLGFFMVEILPLIIVSALLAFLMYPMTSFITNRLLVFPLIRHNRTLATMLSFAVAIFVVITILLVVVPTLTGQVQEFVNSVPSLLRQVERVLENWLSQPLMFNGEPILLNGESIVPLDRIAELTGTSNLNEVIQLANIDLSSAAQTFFGSVTSLSGPAFSVVGGAFNTIINFTFLFMMTFYLLKDGGSFIEGFISLAPDGYEDDARRLFEELGRVWNGYIRGQAILCLVMGLAVYLAASLLGVPDAPMLGLLAGVLEFIPTLGPLLALIPASFLALVSHSTTVPWLEGIPFAIVVIVVWTMLQNIEAIILVPRIMGDSLDLHPLVVIIGVLGGAALAGALGVILAAPFIASGRVVSRYFYGKITGRPTFVEHHARDRRREMGLSRTLTRWYRYLRLRLNADREQRSPVS